MLVTFWEAQLSNPYAVKYAQGMLEIVSAATEFDTVPLRPGEEDTVKKLLNHAPVAVSAASSSTEPCTCLCTTYTAVVGERTYACAAMRHHMCCNRSL